MNKILQLSLTLLLTFCAAGYSKAQSRSNKTKHRQVKQESRIHQGVKSGEVTKKESKVLHAQQANIQHTKKAARADGVVTPKEKAVITHKQNKASKNIQRAKNNDRSRK